MHKKANQYYDILANKMKPGKFTHDSEFHVSYLKVSLYRLVQSALYNSLRLLVGLLPVDYMANWSSLKIGMWTPFISRSVLWFFLAV